MRKKMTGGRLPRRLRLGAAMVLAAMGAGLLWLSGDPGRVEAALSDTGLTVGLLAAELGSGAGGLSGWDRLVLDQSSLLRGEAVEPTAAPVLPEASLPPAPTPTPPEETEPPVLPTEEVIAKTMVAGTSDKYISSGRLSIYNHTGYVPDIPALLAAAPELTPAEEGPTVLIFHSHATEAYTMSGGDVYEESDSYRTLNTRQNMVRVGEEMKRILEAAGIGVLHDTTLYDYPSYNEAYSRSGEGVARWLEQYPSIRLVLDVHRDALAASDGTIYKTAAGTPEDCAQIMLVMGSDAMGQYHPNWRTNLALALSIQNALAEKWATLARPLVLRTSRFNQQLSGGMLLVEVGTHGNTLQEAITAARVFARTVADMILE